MKAKTLEDYYIEAKKCIGKPHMLANLNVEASADFARYSEMFAEYEIKKAKFLDIIKTAGEKPLSDTVCENKWLIEEDGQKWIYLKHYLRGLRQINKSIETASFTANQEARSIQ